MIHSHIEELDSMKRFNPDIIIAELVNNQQKIKSNDEIYYNEELDKVWKKLYYRDISTNMKDPHQIFEVFHELVSSTHRHLLPYYVSKDQYLYTWVDLQPNGQLKCIYSGLQRDPQQLIHEDFEVIERRFLLYRELIRLHKFSTEQMVKEVKNIGRQHRFNTEHVVPQSWFRAEEPMKGDLHHLFVCEPRCNNMRSNYPYFEYDDDPYINKNMCGINGFERFEPSYGKGIVARAMLYFLLRYPNAIKPKYEKTLDIPLLLRWHEKYKVTEYEKHRNKAIFEIQGNRNPFIDFPELMSNIAFPH